MINLYTPLVSIVIPAYNASNYLREAIDSALDQTYKNIEIIVINDGSRDNGATRAVALEYGDKITYIEKENGGSSSALNTGISAMRGEWFSWLSHDDLYFPNKVERQIEYLNKLGLGEEELHKHILFSGYLLCDAEGKTIREPSRASEIQRQKTIRSLAGNEYLVAEPTKYCFHGCAGLLHKSVFEKIGLFDESLRFVNDMDLWFRIYTNGYILNYIPEVLVKGRVHEKQVSRGISFSYNNSEQDMYWNRSFRWLSANHPTKYDVFYLFGKEAYKKNRPANGREAFEKAASLSPDKRLYLSISSVYLRAYAWFRTIAKRVYLKIKA